MIRVTLGSYNLWTHFDHSRIIMRMVEQDTSRRLLLDIFQKEILVVCGNVLAICTCSDHVISYDLTNYENASNYSLDFDTRIVQFQKNLPSTGIDYVIHFEHPKSRFFERIGNWFRIWYSKR